MRIEVLKQTMNDALTGNMKFPQIVGKLLEEGVESYHIDFVRAEGRYYHADGGSQVIQVQHDFPKAAIEFDVAKVSAAIKKSQNGLITYPTFIEEVMSAGCVYYMACLFGRRVIYFGRTGESHVEHFHG